MVEFHKTKNLKRIQMVQSQFLKGRFYNVKVLLQNLVIIIAINQEGTTTPSQQIELVLPAVLTNFQDRHPAKEIRGRCPAPAPPVGGEGTETQTASIEGRFQNWRRRHPQERHPYQEQIGP